ncbi:Disease resistance protein [Macleaya cordata]|uniref:Disease resistance protein n=1 Tax=Macleaya cordata TaxID=56857 RepID=A0A200Q8R0_MACCD|nr:Disease resistance protein [Macleaya cordata]
MTEPVVGFLVHQLLNSIKEEANVFFGFQSQVEKMKKNLNPMKSFLIDLRQLKNTNNNEYEIVKLSLATLREIIYDSDDVLLDCRIRADDYHREYSISMIMPCTLISPSELFFRYQTGRRLKEINIQISETENILKTYCTPFLIQKISQEDNNNTNNTRWTTHIFDQSEVVGLTEDMSKIKQWILPIKTELQRVGIVGMGGLGKTTIAQKIFNDKEIIERYKERIWISVSQTVNVVKIMKSMLEQLRVDKEDINGIEGILLQKVRRALMGKSYLIVMDDVWSIENGWWTQIFVGLPKEGENNYNQSQGQKNICNRRSIIITTRNEQVAESMGVTKGRIYRPKTLNQKDSWSLFHKVAFLTGTGISQDPEFISLGKDIVEKCDGLPLAIKTIGGLLSTKTQSIFEWEKIRDDFYDKLAENVNENGSVIASLQLSYDALPARLKQCILCFSIYPEESHISVEQLVRWWVGEGIIQGNEKKSATQLGYDCLSELFSRCLVDVVDHRGYDGGVDNCKMHDMIRELIIRMAKEEAFCSFDERNGQKFDSDSRHLGVTSEIGIQPLQTNSKIRALILTTSTCQFNFSPNTGLAKVKSLRVLDLSLQYMLSFNFHFEDLFGWIKSQKRLAYLNLRGVADMKELPHWIRKLQNLQFFILNECHLLEKLSSDITTLQNLIVLDVRHCPSLQYFPRGMGKLSNLEELSGFKLGSPGIDHCRLGDLKSLTKLRILRVEITEHDEIAREELDVLSQLHLQVLSIDTKYCGKEEILMQLDQLTPPQSLRELYLRNHRGSIPPNWLKPSFLPRLRYLCIEYGECRFMGPSFSGSEVQKWKLEGLCLK